MPAGLVTVKGRVKKHMFQFHLDDGVYTHGTVNYCKLPGIWRMGSDVLVMWLKLRGL